MKQGQVFFHPIEGSGQLGISWSSELKGDAVEAEEGSGVGFFSTDGKLLSVLFDEVGSFEDAQILTFPTCTVTVTVTNGHVTYRLVAA